MLAQHRVNQGAVAINRAIQISPVAVYADIRSVDVPAAADFAPASAAKTIHQCDSTWRPRWRGDRRPKGALTQSRCSLATNVTQGRRGVHGAGRARARPYICRSTSLSFVICPSVCNVRPGLGEGAPDGGEISTDALGEGGKQAVDGGRHPWGERGDIAMASAGTPVSIAATVTTSVFGRCSRRVVIKRLSSRAGGGVRAYSTPVRSLRRCLVAHSVTTRRPPLKPPARSCLQSAALFRQPASQAAPCCLAAEDSRRIGCARHRSAAPV